MPYLHDVQNDYKKASFGMGCFWGCDSVYGVLNGVLRTKVGYSGGQKENPTYRDLGDHTEIIEIHFDPTVISYEDLLDKFWSNHEYAPTDKIKVQYMSLIIYHGEEQKQIALESIKKQGDKLKKEVKTVLKSGDVFKFYPAEDYHQKYRLQGHPDLMKSIGLTPDVMLQTSHLAARLNGFLVGLGGIDQFNSEAEKLGLNEKEQEYVRKYIKQNENSGNFC